MKRIWIGTVLLFAAPICFAQLIPVHWGSITTVEVTDFMWMGTWYGLGSDANCVNANAEVAGSVMGLDGMNYPYAYRRGAMKLMGYGLPGEAWAINSSCHVAGGMDFSNFGLGWQAFLSIRGWDATPLGKLPGLYSSFGYAMNDQDVVVGESAATGGSPYYAVKFENGQVIPLPAFSLGRGKALGISNTGFITGFSLYIDGPVHAFLVQGNSITDIDIANPGGSEGMAVNDLGHVVGYRNGYGFLYDGVMKTISGLPADTASAALSLDNSDRVVGYSSHMVGSQQIQCALLCVAGAKFSLTDLSAGYLAPGSKLISATHISNNGWISGVGYNSLTGRSHGWRLKIKTPQTVGIQPR